MHDDSLGGKGQVHTVNFQLQPHLNPIVATKFKSNLGRDTNAVSACYCYSTIGLFFAGKPGKNSYDLILKKSLKTLSKKWGKSYYMFEKVNF